jgi:hypothetical protein
MGLVAETKRVGNIRHGIAFADHRNRMRPKCHIAHVLERGALDAVFNPLIKSRFPLAMEILPEAESAHAARKGKPGTPREPKPWPGPAKSGEWEERAMGQWSVSRIRQIGLAVAGVIMAWSTISFAANPPGKIAIADFDYVDTSGEVRDQTADHERRIREFGAVLKEKLSALSFQAVTVPCDKSSCSVGSLGPENLLAAAKAQDARYLVYGGVHKTSTLVQWMKVEMIDLQTGAILASKLVTFRGDTDEAYRRAADFALEDILLTPLRDQKP